jgi:hypothetical protein
MSMVLDLKISSGSKSRSVSWRFLILSLNLVRSVFSVRGWCSCRPVQNLSVGGFCVRLAFDCHGSDFDWIWSGFDLPERSFGFRKNGFLGPKMLHFGALAAPDPYFIGLFCNILSRKCTQK